MAQDEEGPPRFAGRGLFCQERRARGRIGATQADAAELAGLAGVDHWYKRCNPERMAEVSEQALIGEVAERLARNNPTVPQEAVAALVNKAHSRFDQSKVRDFVPLLVERRAKVQLAKLGAELVNIPVPEVN